MKTNYQYKINKVYKDLEELAAKMQCKEQLEFEIANYVVKEVEEVEQKNKADSVTAYEISKKIKNRNELQNCIINKLGHFYFNFYRPLLKLKIERQYIFRFIFLCTYLNYNNKLEFGNGLGDSNLLLEKDLAEVLKLSVNETIRTKKVLKDNKLISINTDSTISINKKYYIKGDVSKPKVKGSVRIMEQGIQELYLKAKATEHKRLALLIELLPYVNFHHNILCFNPEEENVEEIKPLKMSDICEILGYDKTKSTRLKRDLFAIKVNGELTVGAFETEVGRRFYINPKVYYKGTNYNNLIALVNMFRVK